MGVASGIGVTMRVLPEHPFEYALKPGDLPTNWIAAGQTGRANAYLLPASHARLVEDHELTPEDEITPLTKQQEWPRGFKR